MTIERLWGCRTASQQLLIALLCITGLVAPTLVFSSAAAANPPACESADSDPDGDGWGWENNQSCKVEESAPVSSDNCDYSQAHLYGGWGWDPVARESCPPVDQPPAQQDPPPAASPDNNCDYSQAHRYGGWGWDPVARESCEPVDNNQPDSDGSVSDPTNSDIVLVFAGQSIAIANRNFSTDSSGRDGNSNGDRVFAWIPSQGEWAKANLCTQRWDNGSWPDQPSGNYGSGQNCGNHPGYQMALKLVEETNRDVYLIATGEDGQPIERWIGKPTSSASFNSCLGRTANSNDFDGRPAGNQLDRLVNRIEDAVPSGVQVDAFGWIQGEANAQAGSLGELRHKCKLLHFADRLDAATSHVSFSSNNTSFISAHILTLEGDGRVSVNTALDQAAGEAGSWMRTFAPSANYGHVGDRVHFDNAAIRNIGRGMACEYLGRNNTTNC